jgi:predicted dehydrogenase
MNRRDFIINSAVVAGSSLVFTPYGIAAPRASKYKTVLIGAGWWGMNILRCAMAAGESKVVAICDVDDSQSTKAAIEITKLSGEKPKIYKDYRELIAQEKPEIVINATPDHWHALVTIEAIKNGAHVYVEKPISHTINEGTAMVAAARKYERMVQVGTHRRVSPHNISGMNFLKSGKAGKIGMVRTFVNYGGNEGEITPDSDAPKGLDWDMWCGPAPLRPFNAKIHPRGFRQFLDYANGQLGDWGIHWLDQVLWWTEEKHPQTVYSTGGRAIKKDNTDAPDHQIAVFDFESFTLSWEHRQFAANNAEKTNPSQPVGCYFYGTEGTFHMSWIDGWTFYPADHKKPTIHEDAKLDQPDGQNITNLWADFLQAIKTNRLPVCDIEIGQRSTNLALLGMLSMKLGRSVNWDGTKGIIPNDSEASKLLSRAYRKGWEYPK